MLDTGADNGWFDDPQTWILATVALVGFCYFLVWELTEKHPVVDLRLFKRRNFSVGVGATSIGYMMFFGIALIVPLWLQTQMGYTAAWAGLGVRAMARTRAGAGVRAVAKSMAATVVALLADMAVSPSG